MNLAASLIKAHGLRTAVAFIINEVIARRLDRVLGVMTLIETQNTVAVGRSAAPR